MLKNMKVVLKYFFITTKLAIFGYINWKVIVGVQGKLRIF